VKLSIFINQSCALISWINTNTYSSNLVVKNSLHKNKKSDLKKLLSTWGSWP